MSAVDDEKDLLGRCVNRRDALVLVGLPLLSSAAAFTASTNFSPVFRMSDKRPRERLADLIPLQFGGWVGTSLDQPLNITPDLELAVKEAYDDTLSRHYVHPNFGSVYIVLAYVAHVNDERRAHSPEVCYPAQGAVLTQTVSDRLSVMGSELPVRRFKAKLHTSRAEDVLYWIAEGGAVSDSSLSAKVWRLKLAMQRVIPDAILVRLSRTSASDLSSGDTEIYRIFVEEMLKAVDPVTRDLLVGNEKYA